MTAPVMGAVFLFYPYRVNQCLTFRKPLPIFVVIMPWRRKGLCVYKIKPNGSLGEKVGCSETTAKARAHLKALYANYKGESYKGEK